MLNKQIFRLAAPNIISNISVPLLGMIDTALMGHLESETYLGAIAIGGIIFSFLYMGVSFLRAGTTGMTAQAFGREDEEEAGLIFWRAIVLALLLGFVFLLAQSLIGLISFSLIEGTEEVKALAKEYYYIRIYAAPAAISLYVFNGWFLGMQNARYPLYLTVWVSVLNIGFNLLFLYGFGMKSDGVAWGTVCAQYGGLLLAIGLWRYRFQRITRYWDWAKVIDIQGLKRFFSVNSDIFIRTICLIFSLAFFTSKSSSFGDTVLAANQILLQYFYLLSYGIDGFAFAAESLVGRYWGEGNWGMIRRLIRRLLLWGLMGGLFFSLLYLFIGQSMLQLFTVHEDVIELATVYMLWLIPISMLGSFAFIWDGVYMGATLTAPMRNMMILATFGVFLPSFYLGFPYLGNHALWLSMSLFMLLRWGYLHLWFRYKGGLLMK